MRSCSAEGCDRPHCARGLCNSHYAQWRRNGDEGVTELIPRGLSAEDRFWRMVDLGHPDACWRWLGTKRNGYGMFAPTYGHSNGAHRFAYELFSGPIPVGREIDHLCRNRACVNPAHMEAVTRQQHAQRHPLKLATHCKRGHPFDEKNTYINATSGARVCRACLAMHQRTSKARRKNRLG